ncbi:hypothetical protein BGY98DRAFT_619211 [Russula aff. rugulosa BPL654]|nr:hypothetical protein BGY98DRAFT_619211 [Russula aff. rugulosa BPL654]
MSSNSTKSLQRSSFLDILKPRYHEAVYRLKNSLIALIALFTLTHLLPLPTPYASAWNFYRDSFQSSWEKSVAIAELFVSCLLLANIFQSTIAIRSPPAPYPPLPSPSKSLSPRSKGGQQQPRALMTPPTWRGKSGGLSPKITPQRQLAFSTTTPAGSNNPVSASAGSASDPRGLAQSYKLTFANHHSSPPDISISSSTGSSSLPPSPSPAQATSPLAAYRGRRAPTGRALDGSLLARLAQVDSDSDADE